MQRKEIIQQLNAQININGHVIGAVVGSGMIAKCVIHGGSRSPFGIKRRSISCRR